jgi:mRNA interferase RelE/StbE
MRWRGKTAQLQLAAAAKMPRRNADSAASIVNVIEAAQQSMDRLANVAVGIKPPFSNALCVIGLGNILQSEILKGVKAITYTTTAVMQLRKLPPHVRERLIAKLHAYAEGKSADVKALKGQQGARLRAGDYRIVFVETATAISVRAAGHRREIYD